MFAATRFGMMSGSKLWDISTAAYSGKSLVTTSQDGNPISICFSSDGLKFYLGGSATNKIFQYTLSVAYDLSTATYASKFYTLAFDPWGLSISPDGTKLYVIGNTTLSIYQYTLSTPWDVSTSSSSASKNVTAQTSTAIGVNVSPDGTTIVILGASGGNLLHQYLMSTPWSLSTATFVKSSAAISEDAVPNGVAISPDGTHLYIPGYVSKKVYEYGLATGWDLATLSYTGRNKSYSAESTGVSNMAVNPDGRAIYMTSDNNNSILQYSMG